MTQSDKIRMLAEVAKIEVDEVPIDPRDLNKTIFVIRDTFINYDPLRNIEQAVGVLEVCGCGKDSLLQIRTKFGTRLVLNIPKVVKAWPPHFSGFEARENFMGPWIKEDDLNTELATAICEAVLAVLEET